MAYRILIIHDDASTPGGTNVYRQELTKLFESQGHDVHLFTFRADTSSDPLRTYSYGYGESNKFLRYISRSYFSPPLFFFLKKIIREVEPDFIHIHHNYFFTNTVLLACRGRIPVVQTHHDHRVVCPRGIGITAGGNICQLTVGLACLKSHCFPPKAFFIHVLPKYLATILMKKTLAIALVPSSNLKKKIEARGVPTTLLRNYVDLTRYQKDANLPDSSQILFVGRLYEGKGIHTLLQAFKKVVEDIPDAKLDIVGTDESVECYYSRMVQSLDIETQVVFHRQVAHKEIAKFYRQACLVVLPAVWIENNPLVLLEAMAAGRPIVASRIGGIPEIVDDGKNGLLCNPGDADDLCDKIVRLLHDKKMAKAMGDAGRNRAERDFSQQKHFDTYMQIIQGLTTNEGLY